MNYCDSCKHFEPDGAVRVPCPPDIDGPCWNFVPHCTHEPLWQEILDPSEHYCAHWQEKDERQNN